MLSKLTIIVLVVAVFIFLYFFILAKKSYNGSATGLIESDNNGKHTVTLHLCSSKPNCVTSESGSDAKHTIEPYSYKHLTELDIDDKKLAKIVWQSLIMTLNNAGAVIHVKQSDYIAATFSTTFFGFIDDFEVRLDIESMQVHFRSASRVGTSDFGANKKRVKAIMDLMETNLQRVLDKIS